ncbi:MULTISPECIES: hypothetical protein [Acinetobacter]|uniref:hypothetical protein n=1 Tax=Acinetobacter TaxID=469 RepID=UPI0018FF494D|nr:hypothetical protein [Acinetobacter bereziniae]MBJ8554233.1 hypothetical protein [Acinetobacter bereziniae]
MQSQVDLNCAMESEVLGELLFITAADYTKSSEQKFKWQLLAKLETQTLERLQFYLQQNGQTAYVRSHIKLQAKISGIAMAKLPWKLAMYLLKQGTNPFIKVFERMDHKADRPSQDFFKYLLAHEYAIAEFARLELQGESIKSIKLLFDLIEKN